MNIVDLMLGVILRVYGREFAGLFLASFSTYYRNQIEGVAQLSEAQQIHLMNDYWRNLLAKKPNTLEIRTWLCEGDSVAAYVTAFEDNWGDSIFAIGPSLFSE